MQGQSSQTHAYTPISSGVDWITATASTPEARRAFRHIADEEMTKEMAAGGDIRPAAIRDYAGRRGDGLFYGLRDRDAIIVASGPRSSALFASVAQAATNVSRLDLQVTVWTHGEQPHLALQAYNTLQRLPPRRGRPPSATLLQTQPKGETLNVNRRKTDSYGRLYDWASAHKAGTERTVWRYEVEFKRELALSHCNALLRHHSVATASRLAVRSWWELKGVELPWTEQESALASQLALKERSRDVLSWMETSLRKTVASAVNRYGLPRVLYALGLLDLVEPRRKEDN